MIKLPEILRGLEFSDMHIQLFQFNRRRKKPDFIEKNPVLENNSL